MDFDRYLEKFNAAANQLDKKLYNKKGIEIKTGVWLKSVALKLQKETWHNKSPKLSQPESSIFFSIWLNDATIKEGKLLYNIHALKLRYLEGYSITSREFATAFRTKFKSFERNWPNVSVKYGPLTLMEGWQPIDIDHFQKDIVELANQFLQIDHIIDDLLGHYKKK